MSSGSIPDHYIGNYRNSRTWTGTNNPKPPFGEHPYSLTMYAVQGDKSKIVQKDGYGNWYASYSYLSDCNPEIARTFLDSTEADFRCQSKMTSEVRAFNSAVFAATLGQSIGQIVHASTSVLHAALAVKRGDLSGAARVLLRAGTGEGYRRSRLMACRRKALSLSDPAQQWLAFQYGWLPFMSDVYEGVAAVKAMREEAKLITRVRAVSKDTYTPANQRLSCRREARVSRKYVLQEPPSTNLTMGLIDPLSVAWELLPFSFVADWFLPVGGFLENMSVLPFLQGTVVKGVMLRNSLDYGSINFTQQGAFSLQYISEGSCHACCVKYDRTVSTVAQDQVTRPSFKPWAKSLSEGHLKNAAALIISLLSSVHR